MGGGVRGLECVWGGGLWNKERSTRSRPSDRSVPGGCHFWQHSFSWCQHMGTYPPPTQTHPHAHTPRPSLGKYLNTAALSNLWLACYQSGPDSTHASLHHQSSLSVWTVLACVTESTGLYLCVQAGDYKWVHLLTVWLHNKCFQKPNRIDVFKGKAIWDFKKR